MSFGITIVKTLTPTQQVNSSKETFIFLKK